MVFVINENIKKKAETVADFGSSTGHIDKNKDCQQFSSLTVVSSSSLV